MTNFHVGSTMITFMKYISSSFSFFILFLSLWIVIVIPEMRDWQNCYITVLPLCCVYYYIWMNVLLQGFTYDWTDIVLKSKKNKNLFLLKKVLDYNNIMHPQWCRKYCTSMLLSLHFIMLLVSLRLFWLF